MTPLHFAVENGHLSVIEYLVNQKADIKAKNDNGSTPFALACDIDEYDSEYDSEFDKKMKSNVVEFLMRKEEEYKLREEEEHRRREEEVRKQRDCRI